MLAVFALSTKQHTVTIGHLSFIKFITPGLIIMAAVQNAFANTSSTLIISKVMGTIIDYLMPPISPAYMVLALALAGVIRGIAVGLVVALGLMVFVPLEIFNIFYLVYYTTVGSLILSMLGILVGMASETYDQVSAITNYIINPLTFLSGTFYSIHNLPAAISKICYINPFFYMVDGFRYSMTGYHDGSILIGSLVLATCAILISYVTCIAFKAGWCIKN
jgi:ABC-2 type transport system permease protein